MYQKQPLKVSLSKLWTVFLRYTMFYICTYFPMCPPDSQVKMWVNKYGWSLGNDYNVFIANQEDNIKTKNITEKITFDSQSLFYI